MPVREDAIRRLATLVGYQEAVAVKHLAHKQDAMELANKRRLDRVWSAIVNDAIEQLLDRGVIDEDEIEDKLVELLARNAKETQIKAIESTNQRKRLAKIPRKVSTVFEWWDYFRKKKKIPKRELDLAKKIKKQLLNKIQSEWRQVSKDFRKGGETTKKEIAEAIKKKAKIAYSRAKMIVETETTRYYNATRKNIYDSSPDVTHYLFVAIRDSATTKWCKTRDGIVLTKDTDLLEENTPPVHWNCRSEILPLLPLNPRHKKLIDDKSRRPSNRRLEPLPKEWKRD